MYKVYFLKDIEGNIRYVGITKKTVEQRLQRHIYETKFQSNHKSNWIKSMMINNQIPTIHLVEDNLEIEQAYLKEIYYIDRLRKEGTSLTNISPGGDFNPSLLGEVKDKISKSLKGRKKSEEHCLKMSLSQVGKRLGEENHFYNKKHTEESKKLMSESIKKSFSDINMIERLSSIKNKVKRPILQLDINGDVIKEWDSVSRVWRELGYDRKTIKLVCNGVYKQAYGYKWVYS